MRRAAFAIAVVLVLSLSPSRSLGQGAEDAGPAQAAAETAEAPPRDPLGTRLAKALAFGVVVSALLLAGGLWRRGRRRPPARG